MHNFKTVSVRKERSTMHVPYKTGECIWQVLYTAGSLVLYALLSPSSPAGGLEPQNPHVLRGFTLLHWAFKARPWLSYLLYHYISATLKPGSLTFTELRPGEDRSLFLLHSVTAWRSSVSLDTPHSVCALGCCVSLASTIKLYLTNKWVQKC
jgi:hypothetical protein